MAPLVSSSTTTAAALQHTHSHNTRKRKLQQQQQQHQANGPPTKAAKEPPDPSLDPSQDGVSTTKWDALKRVAVMLAPKEKVGTAKPAPPSRNVSSSTASPDGPLGDDAESMVEKPDEDDHGKLPPGTNDKNGSKRGRGATKKKSGASAAAAAAGNFKASSASLPRGLRGPSKKEIEKCNQRPRFMKALHTWYIRYNELVEFKEKHGHTRVPQKYAERKELGIWYVRFAVHGPSTRVEVSNHKWLTICVCVTGAG